METAQIRDSKFPGLENNGAELIQVLKERFLRSLDRQNLKKRV